jgi:hypothetical protein
MIDDPQRDFAANQKGPTRAHGDGEGFEELIPQTVMDTLAEQERRMREFIRSHPLAVVAGALALGFVVARAIREA